MTITDSPGRSLFTRVRTVVAALFGILVLFAIIQFLPLPRHHHYFWDCIFDTGHILIFGGLAVMLLLILQSLFGSKWLRLQYISVIFVASTLGLLLEIWQGTIGRNSEWIDLTNDVVGILACSAIYAIFDRRHPEPRPRLLQPRVLATMAAVLVVAALYPLFHTTQVYRHRQAIVPQLVDFSLPWRYRFYYTNHCDFSTEPPPPSWPADAVKPNMVAKLRTKKGWYPGFVMKDVYPDWSSYDYFEMDVMSNAQQPVPFALRVHDYDHNDEVDDRFNQPLMLQPGFQTIRIPLNDIRNGAKHRELDLTEIAGFALFSPKSVEKMEFYLGDIRLTH